MVEDSNSPVFLVGFMGAGKTTVAQALARLLNRDFLDLDQLIESQTGKTIAEVFRELGEPEFRRLERNAILSCRDRRQVVIALGGGAYVSEENRNILRGIGKSVWLDCPLETCLSRVGADESRPLLADRVEMAALLEQRSSAYEKADYIVRTGDLNPDELALSIAKVIARPADES